jgi:hypothetical protein
MRNISRTLIFLLCFFAAEVTVFTSTAFSQEQDKVLVKTEPPLTQGMVNRIIDFFEWSLSVRLSAAQKAEVQQWLINSWKRNDKSEIEGTLQVLKLHSELSALSDEQLGQIRGHVRDEVLKSLREEPNDKIALMLLSLYESSRSNTNQASKSNIGNQTNSSPASVKVGAGDLYGIYIATTKQLVAPVDSAPPGSLMSGNEMIKRGITWQPGRDWITFLPGGRFFARLPHEGLGGFDYAKAMQKNPEAAGTYKVQGNVIRITWAQPGFPERILKRTADGDLWEEKTNWTPLPKVNNLRLSGKYAVLWNEYSARNYIRFTQDGKFEESGMLQQIGWDRTEIPRGSGTYSIYDNTLELRYSDGRIEKINFYVFEEELKKNPPREIYINSFDFKLTQ